MFLYIYTQYIDQHRRFRLSITPSIYYIFGMRAFKKKNPFPAIFNRWHNNVTVFTHLEHQNIFLLSGCSVSVNLPCTSWPFLTFGNYCFASVSSGFLDCSYEKKITTYFNWLVSLSTASFGPSTLLQAMVLVWLVCHCTQSIFFIYSFINRHLDWIHIFTVVNDALINTGEQSLFHFFLILFYL